MTLTEFYREVQNFRVSYTEQRLGQAMWNFASWYTRDTSISEATKVMHGDPELDPFYDDANIPAFLARLPFEEEDARVRVLP